MFRTISNYGRSLLSTALGVVPDWKAANLPLLDLDWDSYHLRRLRYAFNHLYYANEAYSSLNRYSKLLKKDEYYQYTRGIYNPVARIVKTYTSKVYPGAVDYESMTTGAVPVVGDDAVRAALIQLLMTSSWSKNKQKFVRSGAKLGDAFIKVVDYRTDGEVVLEPLSADYVKYMRKDSRGNIIEIHIEYDRYDSGDDVIAPMRDPLNDTNTYTYTEVITPERFFTFRDGEPWAINQLPNGELVADFENVYGFVPIVHALHEDEDLMYGSTPFNSSLAKINEINSYASLVNDQTQKIINPVWAFFGVQRSELELETDREKIPALFMSKDADAKPLVMPMKAEDALPALRMMLDELEEDLPELSLHRIKDNQLSGVAIRNAYDDAASRIEGAQSAYDDALVRACKMAIGIGAMNRYDGYTAFNPLAYERGDIDFHLKARPVFQDTLDKQMRITFLMQSGAPQSAIWREMDYSDEDISKWQTEQASTEQAAEDAVDEEVQRMSRLATEASA